MGPDIEFVMLRAVGYCFQVVVGDGITVFIGHKVGELFLFPVEEVQSAAFGTDPDVIVFIFHHFTDERVVQAIVSDIVGCINREKVCLRIEIIDATIIGAQPDRALPVFVNGEYG